MVDDLPPLVVGGVDVLLPVQLAVGLLEQRDVAGPPSHHLGQRARNRRLPLAPSLSQLIMNLKCQRYSEHEHCTMKLHVASYTVNCKLLYMY